MTLRPIWNFSAIFTKLSFHIQSDVLMAEISEQSETIDTSWTKCLLSEQVIFKEENLVFWCGPIWPSSRIWWFMEHFARWCWCRHLSCSTSSTWTTLIRRNNHHRDIFWQNKLKGTGKRPVLCWRQTAGGSNHVSCCVHHAALRRLHRHTG